MSCDVGSRRYIFGWEFGVWGFVRFGIKVLSHGRGSMGSIWVFGVGFSVEWWVQGFGLGFGNGSVEEFWCGTKVRSRLQFFWMRRDLGILFIYF